MLTYRTNLAARGTPRPYVAPAEPDGLPDAQPKQSNHIGRPSLTRREKDWNYTAPVLLEVERWLKEHDLTATRFGTLATGDPRLVFDLRMGRDPSSRIVARIRAFMAKEATNGE